MRFIKANGAMGISVKQDDASNEKRGAIVHQSKNVPVQELCCLLSPWSSKSQFCEYHKRVWAAGNLYGTPEAMESWVPRETSYSAKFLKVIEKYGRVQRKMFYDSSMVSNLSSNKAKYIEHDGKGYVLTKKGKEYLRTHNVEVDFKEWNEQHTTTARYGPRRRYDK